MLKPWQVCCLLGSRPEQVWKARVPVDQGSFAMPLMEIQDGYYTLYDRLTG